MEIKDILEKIFPMNPVELLNYIHVYLRSDNVAYKNIYRDEKNNYLIAEGDMPVCLVAHVDTVFSPNHQIYYDPKKATFWSPRGLGADDRAGVAAILYILANTIHRPHLIFTNGEERGGIGAYQLCEDYPVFPFGSCKALIELDRHGNKEAIFYKDTNKYFKELITKEYGFSKQEGIFTDITLLSEYWGISGVNLSVGYYKEHTMIEFLNVNHLYATIMSLIDMLNDSWEIWDYYEFTSDLTLRCECCGKPLDNWEYNCYSRFQGSYCGKKYCWECAEKQFKKDAVDIL